MDNIRNFTIIAHIDHGKSTLADRILEMTETVEKRKMKEQVLDSMDLERERGITIKMQPVKVKYQSKTRQKDYTLNLIDTPGHIDFSYEVSRALKAVEGSLLLVDATQGVQAQTLTTLDMAKDLGLKIIPVVTKIDSPLAKTKEVKDEISRLLKCKPEDVFEVSGKTGEGVMDLLETIVDMIPPPRESEMSLVNDNFRGLVFDFEYSDHKGVIVYVRVFDGEIDAKDKLVFASNNREFSATDVGIFSPGQKSTGRLGCGDIGYIVTGVKETSLSSVGDTLLSIKKTLPAMSGYKPPKPFVWASIYPSSQDDYGLLKHALDKIRLRDASFSFEEESSGSLGRGFRCGFLGMLHLEIITERLKREFSLDLVVTSPTIVYKVKYSDGKWVEIYSPSMFPSEGEYEEVQEPWVDVSVITPGDCIGEILELLYKHEAIVGESETFGPSRTKIKIQIPLREMMRGFFDSLKSASSGFASVSYELSEYRKADVTRLDILVAEERFSAFSKVVAKSKAYEEAKSSVERLSEVLPRQLFAVKIQGQAMGRILASQTLAALKKDVTGHLYGGDITRKMKLREKQKKGKKKMKDQGKINIPQDVFLKMMKRSD